MQRYLALFSPHTIRTTLHLLRRYEILKLRTTNGYRPFRPAAFILGIMLSPREVCCFLRKLLSAEHYLSTRIGDNGTLGWTYQKNILLGKWRAKHLPSNTINPAADKMPSTHWGPTEHMVFWVWVIVALSKRGATLYHFKEDLPGSTGCAKELAMAEDLRMSIVSLP